jgi:tRNA(Arg) A34 adenosine deaminase TadA
MLLPPRSASSGPIYLFVIFVLAIILVPAQPCMLHGPKSFAKLDQVGLHSNPHFKTSDRLQAQNKALDHLEKHKVYREKEAKGPQVRQMSSNSVSDSTYMKLALAAAMECYGPCPALAYGSILVHRPTNEIVMHSCNTAYLDATQHAEMNTIQFAARYYPNHTEAWWSSLTLYTTAEPCPMCMAAARWTGVGEIVFGTSIPTQASYGWESIDVPAQQINSASNHLSTSTLLRGPFETSLTDPYFAWQFNQTAPCPPGCHRDIINNHCNFFF